jgi:hypothetical protein
LFCADGAACPLGCGESSISCLSFFHSFQEVIFRNDQLVSLRRVETSVNTAVQARLTFHVQPSMFNEENRLTLATP